MLTPVEVKVVLSPDANNETFEDLIMCCDSYIAVLKPEQAKDWMNQFESHVNLEYTSYGSATAVFNVDGRNLIVVSDSGGESASGAFVNFCEELGVETQFVIDSLDCTGVAVDEIYTGCIEEDNNMGLLTLLHKVFN